ncbi:MAG: sigma-70 family RNA polymerase sigma factor [Chloroflexota bacterium]|nr:sigma-70 family RNA polymerase sigma factor [Chloroflexota bacterium]
MNQQDVERLDELTLIALAVQGKADAFQRLYTVYAPPISHYLRQFVGNTESAQDLTQETFLAAYRALPRWQLPASRASRSEASLEEYRYLQEHPLAPWLYRIATNCALNYLKAQAVRSSVSDPQPGRTPPWAEVRATPEDQYVVRELLREALSHLSQEDAACLLLRFVEDEHYREIAVRLGISQEAVRKRVTRGLSALRTIYHQLDMEAPR